MDESPRNSPATEVTTLLRVMGTGDEAAADQLLPLVYDELRQLAAARMKMLSPGQTLQPTALVHEAYLKLIGTHDPGWNGRGHFFGAAARAMRQILVDHARRKSSRKHGGDLRRDELVERSLPAAEFEMCTEDMVALDSALRRLESDHPREAEIVLLRYFAGMTSDQVALALGVSSRTVERDWRFARAWLHGELSCPLSEPRTVVDEAEPRD